MPVCASRETCRGVFTGIHIYSGETCEAEKLLGTEFINGVVEKKYGGAAYRYVSLKVSW